MHPCRFGDNHLFFKTVLAVLAWCLLALGAPAGAGAGLFPARAMATDQQLGSMRGGFLLPNGLEISMTVQVSTFYNQNMTENYLLSAVSGGVLSRQTIASIFQVGECNFVSGRTFADFSGVVNLVQNSIDNTVMRHILQVDLNILNYSSLQSGMNRPLPPLPMF